MISKRIQFRQISELDGAEDTHVVVHLNHGHVYTYTFYNHEAKKILRIIGTQAASHDLNLNWKNAAVLSKEVMKVTKGM